MDLSTASLKILSLILLLQVSEIAARRKRNNKGPAVVCRQPSHRGFCHGEFKRWYHDIKTRQCLEFTFSGCYGNENNFQSKEKCDEFCSGRRVNPRCDSDKEPGPCYSSIPSYYFDKKTRTCQKFMYGGCKGNKNRYHSLKDCERTCVMTETALIRQKDKEDTCLSNPDPGPCSAHYRRFYYDASEGRCKLFVYGGCRGNLNRFSTPKECEAHCSGVGQHNKPGTCPDAKATFADECTETCARDQDCPGEEKCCSNGCGRHCSYVIQDYPDIDPSCMIKPDAGPCRAHFERWFYDPDHHECKPFVYGGCLGNANRYPTKRSCKKSCKAKDGIKKFCSKQNGQSDSPAPDSFKNHTLIVTTIQNEPYLIVKEHPSIKYEGNARYEGFLVDLLEAVSKQMGIAYHIKLVSDGQYGGPDLRRGRWSGMVGELLRHKADIAAAALTVNSVREEVIDFTHPFATETTDIMIKKDTLSKVLEGTTNLDNLIASEVAVGVIGGGTSAKYLENSQTVQLQYLWAKVDSEPEKTFLKSAKEGIKRVAEENFAFVVDSSTAEFVVRNDCNITTFGRPFGSSYLSFAVRKHSPLRDPLSHVIMKMRENGDIEILHEKWWEGKCH